MCSNSILFKNFKIGNFLKFKWKEIKIIVTCNKKNWNFWSTKKWSSLLFISICNGVQVLQLALNMRKPTVRERWFLSDPLLFVYIFSNNLTFVSEYNCEQYWRQPYSRDANWNTHVYLGRIQAIFKKLEYSKI